MTLGAGDRVDQPRSRIDLRPRPLENCGNEHEHEDEEKIIAKEQIPEAGFSKSRSSLNIAR